MRAESPRRIDVKEQKPRISPVRANTTPEHRVAVADWRNEGVKARTLAEKARKAIARYPNELKKIIAQGGSI